LNLSKRQSPDRLIWILLLALLVGDDAAVAAEVQVHWSFLSVTIGAMVTKQLAYVKSRWLKVAVSCRLTTRLHSQTGQLDTSRLPDAWNNIAVH
jgi:membrane protein DedA with SNARE-associated domain